MVAMVTTCLFSPSSSPQPGCTGIPNPESPLTSTGGAPAFPAPNPAPTPAGYTGISDPESPLTSAHFLILQFGYLDAAVIPPVTSGQRVPALISCTFFCCGSDPVAPCGSNPSALCGSDPPLPVDPILLLSVDLYPPLAADLIPADPVPPAPCGFVLQPGKSRSQGSAAAALLAMATAGLRQGFSFQLQSWMSNSPGDCSKGEGNILFPGALWDCQFPNPALVWCFAPCSRVQGCDGPDTLGTARASMPGDTEGSCAGGSEGSRAGKTPCAFPVAPPCSWYKLILQGNQEGARGLVMDGVEAQG